MWKFKTLCGIFKDVLQMEMLSKLFTSNIISVLLSPLCWKCHYGSLAMAIKHFEWHFKITPKVSDYNLEKTTFWGLVFCIRNVINDIHSFVESNFNCNHKSDIIWSRILMAQPWIFISLSIIIHTIHVMQCCSVLELGF